MSWICPKCKKEFKNTNQAHSCYTVTVEEHLANKPDEIKKTFDKLLREVNKFGDVHLNPVKTSIQFKARSTFLSVKVKKSCLDIEFQLTEEITDYPVYKTFQISTNRFLHFMKIEKPSELDKKVLGWFKRAYKLMS